MEGETHVTNQYCWLLLRGLPSHDLVPSQPRMVHDGKVRRKRRQLEVEVLFALRAVLINARAGA